MRTVGRRVQQLRGRTRRSAAAENASALALSRSRASTFEDRSWTVRQSTLDRGSISFVEQALNPPWMRSVAAGALIADGRECSNEEGRRQTA